MKRKPDPLLRTQPWRILAVFSPIEKFANKLHAGSPIFEADLVAVRAGIASCKAQAMRLRVSKASDIIQTVRVSAELDRIGRQAA